jgi:hypothetical protein
MVMAVMVMKMVTARPLDRCDRNLGRSSGGNRRVCQSPDQRADIVVHCHIERSVAIRVLDGDIALALYQQLEACNATVQRCAMQWCLAIGLLAFKMCTVISNDLQNTAPWSIPHGERMQAIKVSVTESECERDDSADDDESDTNLEAIDGIPDSAPMSRSDTELVLAIGISTSMQQQIDNLDIVVLDR